MTEPRAAAVLPARPPRRRPPWLLPVAAIVAVLALVLVGVLLLRGDDGAPGDGQATTGSADVRSAVLALEDRGSVVAAALVAAGADSTASVLLPSQLLVDVAGGGNVPLAESAAVGDDAPGQAVADALGVRVDGTWLLTRDGLASLVDAVGGVVVDVDAGVEAGDARVAPGPDQRLAGAQAATFATFLAPGEAEPVRLARVDQVLTGVLAALPDDPAGVTSVLERLGDASRSTLDGAGLAELLATAAGHAASGSYGGAVLPVTEISTGGDEVSYGLDDAAVDELVAARFADIRREGVDDAVRVLVQNGVGLPGLGQDARSRLVEAGYRFVSGGNASVFGRDTTAVLVAGGSPAERETGEGVAEALGLPPDVVAIGQENPTTADVVVILGQDFADLVGRTP